MYIEKQKLVDMLDEIFKPLGFKKKGNNWIFAGEELIKKVNLQKSNFSNLYYLNYNFDIKGYNDSSLTSHVFNRLSNKNFSEILNPQHLLDLEFKIDDNERITQLRTLITKQVIPIFQFINSEQELAIHLKKQPNINMVPLGVKNYLKLQ